jgi:hypothetical protein
VNGDATAHAAGSAYPPRRTEGCTRGHRWPLRAWLVTAAVSCAAVPGRSVSAQESPAIRGAVQLAAEGRGDSARRIVAAALARARPGEPAYVEALYWRGRLATSGDSAALDFRRVAIEFSTSSWADQALLQLAQLAMAAGKPAEALEDARRIRSDYPHSTLGSRAAMWAGRAAFEIGDPAAACALLDSARQEAAADVELVNQITYYRGRCSAALAGGPPSAQPQPAGADSTSATRADTSRRAAPAAASPAAPSGFAVQVIATRSSRTARTMLERVRTTGLNARIVAGADGYLRVRAGPFPTRREADAAADRLRRALGGHPLVVPEP